jgi:hypothetical protein
MATTIPAMVVPMETMAPANQLPVGMVTLIAMVARSATMAIT